MVKPPVVHLASMLRAVGRYVDTTAWVWLCNEAGQQLFWPPNVAGWDDTRWLDTSRMRARWNIVDFVLDGISVNAWERHTLQHDRDRRRSAEPGARLLGQPRTAARTPRRAARLRPRTEALVTASWEKGPYRAMRQNALLQLIGISPDLRPAMSRKEDR